MARPFRSLMVVLALVAAGVLLGVSFSNQATLRASEIQDVRLQPGAVISLATPAVLQAGKRYAFTWPGGGPPQTYTVKSLRPDGWILVEVADEITKTDQYLPNEFPTRWLNAAMASSIQEMKPLLY